MYETIFPMLFIFFARICDVSLGTIRIILITRGHKFLAPLIGFFEVFIWLFAIGTALKNLDGILNYIIYAGGFASGNYVGMLLEERLKLGFQSIRIITSKKATELHTILRNEGFDINTLIGNGNEGEVSIIYTVISRKKVNTVLDLVRTYHPKAFVTIEDVKAHYEGYITQRSIWSQLGRIATKKK